MATVKEIEEKVGKIPSWLKYMPTDLHYIKFNQNVLVSLHSDKRDIPFCHFIVL